jgi:hypothetical protein
MLLPWMQTSPPNPQTYKPMYVVELEGSSTVRSALAAA